MYQEYFSLERHPFRITPDTSLFFSGGDQGRGVVLDALLFAIESGEGIIKVVGEVGSGKTMLCRMLEERLPESTEIVYLANPRLSPDEILYAVAFELKLPVRSDTSKLLVMQQLQTYLIKQHTANRKVLVIIEEAQGMPVETLEEIRLFSNLETQVDKLMQIVLFGQPELDKNLSSKGIRQLRERITHSFHLNPLTSDEAAEYVRFRLGAAGCPCPQLLTEPAQWLLFKVSGGLTRRINILVDKALLAAYADNVLDSSTLDQNTPPVVTVRHIWAAICDSDYLSASLYSLFSPLRVASAGMVVAVLAIAIVLWPQAGSIAGPNRIAEQIHGAVEEQGGSQNLTLQREDVVSKSHVQKAQLIPLPQERDLAPLDVTNDISQSSENGTTDAAGFDHLADEAANVSRQEEELLVEGFTQPNWVANISSKSQQPIPDRLLPALQAAIKSSQLTSRVLASIDWLEQAGGDGYTVQFLSGETSNMEFAEAFLQVLDEHDLIADSYICMSNNGIRSYWTVKYGNFEGLSLAQKFIDTLPAKIHEYQPFVQNMSNVECNSNPSIAALILE